jgi:glycerol-3-phosphate acyltransferase PlsY
MMLNAGLIAILSYLTGSIPFGVIVGRLWKGIDIRDYGSKNMGFTNVYRVIGTLPAVIVLILDITKGMIAVLLLTRINLDPEGLALINLRITACIFVIVGHVFPLFAGFRGGKGIATGLGALWSIIPIEVSIALFLFLIIVTITRYVSLGSLVAAGSILLALLFKRYYLNIEIPTLLIIMIACLTVFIFFNHRSNIKRLLAGNENKFGRRKVE